MIRIDPGAGVDSDRRRLREPLRVNEVDCRAAEVDLSEHLVGYGIACKAGRFGRAVAGRVVLQNAMVVGVGDVEVACAVGSKAEDLTQPGGIGDAQLRANLRVGAGVGGRIVELLELRDDPVGSRIQAVERIDRYSGKREGRERVEDERSWRIVGEAAA